VTDRLLAEKRAIVTGAGSGIGRGSAIVCAREGARVGVLDIDGEAAKRTAADITAAGGHAVALTADLTSEVEVDAAVAESASAWGGLDVVVVSRA
jgi:NAD(P)-dependent dehydrogenase (short-subunit alcohol dehydrogenase family)